MMNSTVRQPVAIETVTAATQPKTAKEKNTDDGKFMNMLSDAINNKPNEAVKPPETAKEAASAKNESEQPLTQEKTETQPSDVDQDGGESYEQQATAVAAAMQMQGFLPVIEEIPQVEVPEEIMAVADEPLDMQPAEEVQTAVAQTEAAAAEVFQPKATQDIPSREAKTETVTAERPQMAESTAETEMQTKPAETTAPRTAEKQEAAPDMKPNRQEPQIRTERPTIQPQTVQRQDTVQQRPDTASASDEAPKEAVDATVVNSETEAQAVRQNRPHVPMHQMRNPAESEAAQAKFDGMLEKASRELKPTATVQEVQPEAEIAEVAEEIPTAERPVNIEAKPQEQARQAEAPKTEIKPQEEAKPTEQATVQKSVKAPVTEQRPQKEISKNDEALLGMTQHSQPEIRHEVIRSEPVLQHQPQVHTPDQAEQIKAQVIHSMENERTEFQMQLQPEELGKVNVKMVLEGGRLSVEIAAINPKSAEMLSRQAESLAASLRASGADVASVNVVTATENASAEMNGAYNLNNFQNREGGQSQQGRASRTGETGEQGGNVGPTEQEAPKAPQRILNYSV